MFSFNKLSAQTKVLNILMVRKSICNGFNIILNFIQTKVDVNKTRLQTNSLYLLNYCSLITIIQINRITLKPI